jgi:hypothetical protein
MRQLSIRALIRNSVAAATLIAAPFVATSFAAAPAASAATARPNPWDMSLLSPAAPPAARPGPWDVAKIVPASPLPAASDATVPPWQTYRTAPFSYAAGTVCSFTLSGTPVKDGEQYRTLESYPDGTAELNEYRGPLYVRYTNESTGKSAVRNLSGYGFFRFGDGNGTIQALFLANGGISVKIGNQGFPSGYWIEHGRVLVTDNGQGSRVIHVVHATLENLCRTLG